MSAPEGKLEVTRTRSSGKIRCNASEVSGCEADGTQHITVRTGTTVILAAAFCAACALALQSAING
ncbi:MAG: hypothetical protein AAB955_02410 [Patescibacteria group bacterium]